MRTRILAVVAALVVTMSLAAVVAGPAIAFDRVANERTLLHLINHARTKRGLAPVKIQRALDRAALAHSRDMLVHDYFSHNSSGGASYATRLRRAGYSRSGYSSWRVAEVIAWGQSTKGTPQAVFSAWMKSRYHRPIILGKAWRDVGIGCSRGNFGSLSGVIMYTVDFGRRVR